MFFSQQISSCLLAAFIAGSPLVLPAQDNKTTKPEISEEKKVEKPIVIKSSSDSLKKDKKVLETSSELTDPEQDRVPDPEVKETPPEPEEPEHDRLFRKDVILQINEIIKKSQKDYPALSQTLSNEKKIEILKAVVDTLDRGMEYVPADEFSARKVKDNSEIEPVPAIMIASNQVLYIRLDSLSKKSVKQLKADCESSSNLAKKPLGIIIDLRNTQCFDYQSTIHALGLFVSPQSLQKYNLRTSYKQTLKIPIILLTGGDTSGSAEIFAKLLIEMKRSISLGEKSSGVPFKKRKVTLSNGDFLMIPQIPDMLADIIPESVKPSIIFAPYPQLSYKKISETAGAEKDDKCIQRAVELIICLNALSK